MELQIEQLTTAQLEAIAGAIAARLAKKPARKRKAKGATDQRYLYLTEDELRELFRAIENTGDARDLALFEVAYHRGLRASEVGLLKMGHLRIRERRLYVTRLKGSISGEYTLTDRELRALKAWLRRRGPAPGALFPSRNHRPISRRRLDELMKRYGAAACIPKHKQHFHCLRHSCGTQLVENDVDLLAIQDHLGHADIRNTQIYAKVSDRKRREIGERLAGKW